MAKINFGGVEENVVTREEFPLEKALETLKDETIAVIGYGVQGPGQSLNLRDNGFRVIVGQREGSASWDKAVADGWVPGQTLFGIEEAAERVGYTSVRTFRRAFGFPHAHPHAGFLRRAAVHGVVRPPLRQRGQPDRRRSLAHHLSR